MGLLKKRRTEKNDGGSAAEDRVAAKEDGGSAAGGSAAVQTEPVEVQFQSAEALFERAYPEDKTDREQDLYMHMISSAIEEIDSVEVLEYLISRKEDNWYIANEAGNRRRQLEGKRGDGSRASKMSR